MTPPVRTAVLLVQLGTPDAPTTAAVRRYLREFLSDPRVVDVPRPLWLPILYGPILTFRPRKTAALYRKIWTPEGSPLLVYTQRQAQMLQQRLGKGVRVEFAMRYGNPNVRDVIDRLCSEGIWNILVFPMYPQYAGATTASVYDAVFEAARKRATVPNLRVVPPHYDHAGYIRALAQRVREDVEQNGSPDLWLFSFHGIPQRYVDRGDIYPCHCEGTAMALAAELKLSPDQWRFSFQSRFGPGAWLQPYTDEVFEELGGQGVGKLAVVCPGFTADCLETVDEIAELGAEQFSEAGGGELRLVPCLNDHSAWIDALEQLTRNELAGWA